MVTMVVVSIVLLVVVIHGGEEYAKLKRRGSWLNYTTAVIKREQDREQEWRTRALNPPAHPPAPWS
jgi:hypothetical protein